MSALLALLQAAASGLPEKSMLEYVAGIISDGWLAAAGFLVLAGWLGKQWIAEKNLRTADQVKMLEARNAEIADMRGELDKLRSTR